MPSLLGAYCDCMGQLLAELGGGQVHSTSLSDPPLVSSSLLLFCLHQGRNWRATLPHWQIAMGELEQLLEQEQMALNQVALKAKITISVAEFIAKRISDCQRREGKGVVLTEMPAAVSITH